MQKRFAACLLIIVTLIAAACGNSKKKDDTATKGGSSTGSSTTAAAADNADDNTPGDNRGVTADTIKIGGLGTLTGPLGGSYKEAEVGVKAYIDMVNSDGGVNGRKIEYVANLDDQLNPSKQVENARSLNEQQKVFAILGIAGPLFPAGKYLADNKVPSFGLLFQQEWALGPTLFGENGSFLEFGSPGPLIPYVAKKLGATNAAALAYNVPQSSLCADGDEKSFQQFAPDIKFGYKDTGLGFGTATFAPQVQKIKDAKVDFLLTCMDADRGNSVIARNLKESNVKLKAFMWPNGYSYEVLNKFKDLMEGVYISSFFTPFEAADYSPGMQKYLSQMKKTAPNQTLGEYSLDGWLNADLFVRGLKASGKNPTREKLVDNINKLKHWTAEGILGGGVDWTTAHTQVADVSCTAFVQVKAGKFVPVLGENSSPFICTKHGQTDLSTIKPPSKEDS